MTSDNSDISAALGRIEQKVNDGQADLSEVKRHLVGNGKPGLLLDVDRLKQHAGRQSWLTRTALGAAIAAAVLTGWKIVTGGS